MPDTKAMEPPLLAHGARHIAIGDSITHLGGYLFHAQLYALTRFPERNLEILNAGVAGDSASGGLQRLDWDVLVHEPDSASIMYGMNDVDRDLYLSAPQTPALEASKRLRIESFGKHMRALIQRLQAAKISVTLITPSPYDETAIGSEPCRKGVNSQALTACAAHVFRLAREFDLPVIDFQSPMLAINQERQKEAPTFSMIGDDRVHPGPAGHLFMGWLFLKARKASSLVAHLEIDGARGDLREAINCTVGDIALSSHALSFHYHARSLPFPILDAARRALDWAPIEEELNQETVRIERLPQGLYDLQIDGQMIGECTSEDLAEGINLAIFPNTPQHRQSQRILLLMEAYWENIQALRDIVFIEHAAVGWELQRPLTFDHVKPSLDRLLANLAGSSSEAYYRKTANVWIKNKKRETDLKEEASSRLRDLRKAAHPTLHKITIQSRPKAQ